MEKVDYKKINEIIEDYINYLAIYNPIFLDNAEFFYVLSNNYIEFEDSSKKYNWPKMNASDSFKLVKEFYTNFYKEDIIKIEKLFDSGIFNIYYIDELREEKIYLTIQDITFNQGRKDEHDYINLPLHGDIRDIHLIIHEIRHQLNEPEGSYRNIDNDTLTETLSMFDEILALDYFKERLSENVYKDLKKYYFENYCKLFDNVNFILELIIVKQTLGYINMDNYEMLFNNLNHKVLEKYLNNFLNLHDSYKNINAEVQNWYILGLFFTSFMHQEYLKDPSYLQRVKKMNEYVKNNQNLVECLKVVGIDLIDSDIINILKESLILETKDIKENVKTL